MTKQFPKHFLSGIDVDYYHLFTKRYLWPEGVNATGRRMIFTGPDGYGNHRMTYLSDHMHVGIGTMSQEGTSSLSYLTRPNWKNPPMLFGRTERRVSDIGWGVPQYSDKRAPLTGFQKRRGLCWGGAEDKYTHRYQYPWSPMPVRPEDRMRPQTAPPVYRPAVNRSNSTSTTGSNGSSSSRGIFYPTPPAVPHSSSRHYNDHSDTTRSMRKYY